MARLKKATPHTSATLTSAAINTPQKSMKSQASYEIPPLDRAVTTSRKALPSPSPHWFQNVREILEEPIYTPALWHMRVCCELLHSRNI